MLGRLTSVTARPSRLAIVASLLDGALANVVQLQDAVLDCGQMFTVLAANTVCPGATNVPDAATCEYAAKVCSGKLLDSSTQAEAGGLTFDADAAGAAVAGCSVSRNALVSLDRIVTYKGSTAGSPAASTSYQAICLKKQHTAGGRAVVVKSSASASQGNFILAAQCERGFDLEIEMCTPESIILSSSALTPPSAAATGRAYRSCYATTSASPAPALTYLTHGTTTATAQQIMLGSLVVVPHDGLTSVPTTFTYTSHNAVCKAFVPRGNYEVLTSSERCAEGFSLPNSECIKANADGVLGFGMGVSSVTIAADAANGYAKWRQQPGQTTFGSRVSSFEVDLHTTNQLGCFLATELSSTHTTGIARLSYSSFFRTDKAQRADMGHSVCLSQQVCNGGQYVVLPPGRACAHGFELQATELLLADVYGDCKDALVELGAGVSETFLKPSSPVANADSHIRIDARVSALTTVSATAAVAAYEHAVCRRSLPCASSAYDFEVLAPGQYCHDTLTTGEVSSDSLGAAQLASNMRTDISSNCLANMASFVLATGVDDSADDPVTQNSKDFYIETPTTQSATPPARNVALRQKNGGFNVNKEHYPICQAKRQCTTAVGGVTYETHTAGVTSCPTASLEVQTATECYALTTLCNFGVPATTLSVSSDALPIGCAIVDAVDPAAETPRRTLIFNEGGPMYKERGVLPRLLEHKRDLRKVCRQSQPTGETVTPNMCSQMYSSLYSYSATHVGVKSTEDEHSEAAVTVGSYVSGGATVGTVTAEQKSLVILQTDPFSNRGDECMQIVDQVIVTPPPTELAEILHTPAPGGGSAHTLQWGTAGQTAQIAGQNGGTGPGVLAIRYPPDLVAATAPQNEQVILEWLDSTGCPSACTTDPALLQTSTRGLVALSTASTRTCIPNAHYRVILCWAHHSTAGTEAAYTGESSARAATVFTVDDTDGGTSTSGRELCGGGADTDERYDALDNDYYDVVPVPGTRPAGKAFSVLLRFYTDPTCETPKTYAGDNTDVPRFIGTDGDKIMVGIRNMRDATLTGIGAAGPSSYSPGSASDAMADAAYSMKRYASSPGRNLFRMYKGGSCGAAQLDVVSNPGDTLRAFIPGPNPPGANKLLEELPNGCASDVVWPRVASSCASNSCYTQVNTYLNTCGAGSKELPAVLLEKKESCDAAVMRAQHATAINTQIPAAIETAKQDAISTALACSSQPGRMYIGNKCLNCKDTNGARLDTCQCPAGQMGVVDTSDELIANPNMHCRACPTGTYQPLAGMLYSAVAVTGNSTRRHLSTAPAASCVQCPKGTYQNQQGQSSCQPCPLGTSTTDLGSIGPGACAGVVSSDYATKSWVDNDSDPPTSIAVILVLILLGLATVALIILVIQLMNQPGGGPPGPMMPAKMLTKGKGKGPGPGMSGKGAGKMSGKGGPKKGSPGGASSGKGKGKGKTSGKGKGKGKK
mmetsp:Transcript_24881/g.62580  ORF Transcript_24881/g.62580 Transcript_24881/m.62580 type:complete len:1452 (-) Transcript_24881:1407-5762(-)